MSAPLQIRNVPEQTRRSLRARAAAQGTSLNSYLLGLLEEEVASPTVAEVLERAAQRAERPSFDAVEAVSAGRAGRDRQLVEQLPE